MTHNRLEILRKKKDELEARIKRLVVNDIKRAVRLENRRKIIMGGWLLKNRPDLVRNIVVHGLTRPQDIRAFADWTESDSDLSKGATYSEQVAANDMTS